MRFFLLFIIIVTALSVAVINFFDLHSKIPAFLERFENTQVAPEQKKAYSYNEHIARGDSYLKQGFAELARDEYLEASEKNTDNSVLPYIKLAKVLAILKQYDGAIQYLQYAEKIDNLPEIQMELAKNYIHKYNFTQAKTILASIKDSLQEALYYDYIINIAESYHVTENEKVPFAETFQKSKTLQKAINDFGLQQDGQLIYLKALVAKALIENEDYEIASILLEKILKERSDYRDSWIMMGYANLRIENYERAKQAYQNAYDIDPTKPETQFFLAIALEETGEKEKALEFYQLAFKNQYTPKAHVVQKIAELSLDLGFYKEAFDLYEELLKTKHESVDDFIRPISIAITKLSDLEKAKKIAEWAKDVYPEEAQSYNLLAWVEIEKGDFSQAQKYLNTAFEKNPKFAAAHYNQGLLFKKQTELQDALQSFETAYKLDKDGPIGTLAAQEYNLLMK